MAIEHFIILSVHKHINKKEVQELFDSTCPLVTLRTT